MVNCENKIRLDAYHDGELSPAERSDAEAHLRDCRSCAAELAAVGLTWEQDVGETLPEEWRADGPGDPHGP